MKKRVLIVLISILSSIFSAAAQDYFGKNFHYAFMEGDFQCIVKSDTLYIIISSPHRAKVRIKSNEPLSNDGVMGPNSSSLTLVPGEVKKIRFLPGYSCDNIGSDYKSNLGFEVIADSNISVTVLNESSNSRGVCRLIPDEMIPMAPDYVVNTNISSTSWLCYGGRYLTGSSQFMIVGIADVSNIEIIPKAQSTARMVAPGYPFHVSLKKGETFFYVCRFGDVSGSIIRSKDSLSKFAVFAGNRSSGSNQPDTNNMMCSSGRDNGHEQMVPIQNWGRSYTALPFKDLSGGYFLKIVATQKNTPVYINGVYAASLNEGESMEHNVPRAQVCKVSSVKPISVHQFIKGTICAGHIPSRLSLSDFSQLTLIPDNNMCEISYLHDGAANPLFGFESYVNVFTKTNDTSSFKVNGKNLGNSLWQYSTASTGYHYATIPLLGGLIRLSSNKGFIPYVYGYRTEEGYAFTAGAGRNIHNKNFISSMGCLGDSTSFTAMKSMNISNVRWNFGDLSPIGNGYSQKHVYNDTGWYNTAMIYYDNEAGITDTVTKRIYVAHSGELPILINDTMICGKLDFNIYAKDFDPDNTYLWNDGHPNYYKNFKVPGLYNVLVVQRNLCRVYDTIRIINHPFPKASFRVSDTMFCDNQPRTVRFINESWAVDTIIANIWDFNDFNPIDTFEDTLYHYFSKADQNFVKLSVVSKYGCRHDTGVLVDVLKSPNADFDILNKDTCLKSNKALFVNKTIKDTTLHKRFKWFFSEGYVISNSNPPAPRSYSSEGRYYALLIYEHTNGCIDTMKKYVDIYKEPVADFKTTLPVSCDGDTVKLINTSTSQNQPLSSLWKTGTSFSDTSFNTQYLYPSKGQYNVFLKVVSSKGCSDSISRTISVTGKTKADFSISDTVSCLRGNAFTFKDLSKSDTGQISSLFWTFSEGASLSNIDSFVRSFSNQGIKTISLKAISNFGCSDSISKQIRLMNDPYTEILVNKARQCEDKQNFVFSLKAPNTALSFKWYYNSDSSSASAPGNIKFSTYGLQLVKVYTNDANNCKGYDSLFVSVNPSPISRFTVSDTALCFRENKFTLINTSSIPAGNIALYAWDFGDGSSSQIKDPAQKKYGTEGLKKIRLICVSDSACNDTFERSIEVYAPVKLQIGNIAPVCLYDSSRFTTVLLNGSAPIASALWDAGDGNTAAGTNAVHTYSNSGQYRVKLYTVSDKGCKDTFDAPAAALVYKLPAVSFSTFFKDGGNNNTLAKFTNTSPSARYIYWDFGGYGNSDDEDTTLDLSDSVTMRVRLKITDYNGCSNSEERIIFIGSPFKVFIPNVFSPNGDGHNDLFGPEGIEYASEYKFTIYNRWGEIVFRSEQFGEKWDGSFMGDPCPIGVFIYTLEFRDYYNILRMAEGSFLLKR